MFLEKRMTDSLAGDWLVALAGWSVSSCFPIVPEEATFLEKRVARLLAGG